MHYTTYTDPVTGYEIKKYTGDRTIREAKLYFSTDNYTADDRYFYFKRLAEPGFSPDIPESEQGLYLCEAATGEIKQIFADTGSCCTTTHPTENYAIINKGNEIWRFDESDFSLTHIANLPKGCRQLGALGLSKNGLMGAAIQQQNKIYAICLIDPKDAHCEILWQTDQCIGHTQFCPTDDETLFYVHETGGDALQRTWFYNARTGENKPYYVEKEGEWITHEMWAPDGESVLFMNYPNRIMEGNKAGTEFRTVTYTDLQYLHPAVSRDGKYCADRLSYPDEYPDWKDGVFLIDGRTGEPKQLASGGRPFTGDSHMHPSFNRAGSTVLFNCPDTETGIADVCAIDLGQVM